MPQTMTPPKKAKKNPETSDGARKLVKTTASKHYRIIPPVEQKLLSDQFRILDNKLGRTARNYMMLYNAKAEITEDCREAGQELVAAFGEEGINTLRIQFGKDIVTLEKFMVMAKKDIKIKK